MKLGFVYIVKNEEQNLKKSLESIKSIADEIVIVDTGSTDKTKEIAKQYTDKVYDYVWDDDFGKARNFSIEKSESDWLLWLDADEELKDIELLKKWKEEGPKEGVKCYTLPLINYVADNPQNMFWTIKLFSRELRFQRRIHEGLNVERSEQIGRLPIVIYHWGYNKIDDESKRKRFDRNIGLLLKQKEVEGSSKSNTFHLGSSYYYIHDYEKAIPYFKELVDGITGTPVPFEIEAATYLTNAYYKLSRLDEAINAAKFLKSIEPCNVVAYYVKGMAMARKGKIQKGLEEVSEALEYLKTSPTKVSTYNYVDYSFANWACNMGFVYNLAGNYLKSLMCYKAAYMEEPDNEMVQLNVLKALYMLKEKKEFLSFYNKHKPKNIPKEILGEMLLEKGV